ncbi:hypothetical protein ABPG75_001058 [Micractinium tetrahymenae]
MAASLHRRGGALLPWEVTCEELIAPPGGGQGADASPPPELSLVDRLAAPISFMHQALVFKQPLDGGMLRAALVQTLALFPTLACRASQDECGEWQLCQQHAGTLLTLGTSTAPLASLAPRPPLAAAAPLADLGGELFGHLQGASLAADALPLLQVALVTLQGSSSSEDGSGISTGCVLGVRVSHLVGDFGTLRAVLHHLAAAYSGRPPSGGTPQPAEPLISALAAAPPPADTTVWNYLCQPPKFMEQMMALVAAPPQQA